MKRYYQRIVTRNREGQSHGSQGGVTPGRLPSQTGNQPSTGTVFVAFLLFHQFLKINIPWQAPATKDRTGKTKGAKQQCLRPFLQSPMKNQETLLITQTLPNETSRNRSDVPRRTRERRNANFLCETPEYRSGPGRHQCRPAGISGGIAGDRYHDRVVPGHCCHRCQCRESGGRKILTMELLLEREYHPTGTNGILSVSEQFLCFTIELPWKDNRKMFSCIPEGRYPIALRYSQRHNNHLMLTNVPDRNLILIHKANNALQELKGCIAPVRELEKPGMGKQSTAAFNKLMRVAGDAIRKGEEVWLHITKLSNRYTTVVGPFV